MSKHSHAQVLAWYAWPVGAEVFGMVGTGLLLPMILEATAQSVGSWSAGDHTTPCSVPKPSAEAVCEARILGRWVNTNSFAMYTRSASMVVSSSLILLAGSLADDPYWRKKLLVLSVYVCVACGGSFFFLPDHPSASSPVITAALGIVSITAIIYGSVCANGYLPILARRSANVSEAIIPSSEDLARGDPSIHDQSSHGSETRPLLARKDGAGISLTLSRMSSTGFACAFVASFVAQNLARVALDRQAKMTTLFAVFSVWFAVAALPPIIFLPGYKQLRETGVSDARDEDALDGQSSRTLSGEETQSTASILGAIKSLKSLSNLRNMLFNWMIVADLLGAMPLTCILQSTSELGFKPSEIMGLGMTVMSAISVSTFLLPHIQRVLGATNLQVLTYSLVSILLYPAYGASSVVNKNWGYQTKASVYVLLAYLGISCAGYISYSRAIYSEMIPPGRETTFFSLWALSDRAGSFFGPLLIAVITQATGRFDYTWLALLVVLALSIPFLCFMDVDAGRIQAQTYEKRRRSADETDA